jgi:hypothetical protein
MSSAADALQSRHDVAAALRMRLITIESGTANWHEWHQAGVLFTRIAHAVYMRHGTNNGRWVGSALLLLDAAEELFVQALGRAHTAGPLVRPAILCDREWADVLRSRFIDLTLGERFYKIEEAAEQLMSAPESDERTHRLAIAQGMWARAQLMRAIMCDPTHADRRSQALTLADYYHEQALNDFRQGVSQDGYQALTSHLIHMALLRSELGETRESRRLAWKAFRIARHQGDRIQWVRALMVAARGTNGEAALLKRRYADPILEEFIEAARRLAR